MLEHIRLLIFDLDYLIFDCAVLKAKALRQSLISFADLISQSFHLPNAVDAEEGFINHGFRWMQFLEIGLDEKQSEHFHHLFSIEEKRLIEAGVGSVFSGVEELLRSCLREGILLALGADANRGYLLAVCDYHQLENLFQIILCNEEFSLGGTDEMLKEIIRQAEVNPSEALALGTRPNFFQAARNLDLQTIGCGWGIHQQRVLANADLKSIKLSDLYPAIQKADYLASQYFA